MLLVMIMAAASLLICASTANWTSTSTRMNDRNNTYNSAVAAAEAATEVVLGYMSRDFYNQGFDAAEGCQEADVGGAFAHQLGLGGGGRVHLEDEIGRGVKFARRADDLRSGGNVLFVADAGAKAGAAFNKDFVPVAQ